MAEAKGLHENGSKTSRRELNAPDKFGNDLSFVRLKREGVCMTRMKDKVCIVTGGGGRPGGLGNGEAAAISFAQEGATVVVNDVDAAAADHTASAIEKRGGVASVYVGDMTRADDARGLVEHAESKWGRLDAVHHNIGISGRGTVVEASEAAWRRTMEVNVTSMMLVGKYAVPALERAGGGSIVLISSVAALRPRGSTPYSASKGAVIALSQAMAVDHGSKGIRVNCIVPGPVYTPMAIKSGMSPERRERRRLASPLGVEGSPWDIAYAAVYLASDEARWVTGVIFPVDGGVNVMSPER